jgi:hypothetical protein
MSNPAGRRFGVQWLAIALDLFGAPVRKLGLGARLGPKLCFGWRECLRVGFGDMHDAEVQSGGKPSHSKAFGSC